MVEESSDPILEIVLEVNDLVQCPGILAHFHQQILAWCKRDERKDKQELEADAPFDGHYRQLIKELNKKKGGDSEKVADEIDRLKGLCQDSGGPKTGAASDGFHTCMAYFETAKAHHVMRDELQRELSNLFARIVPGERGYLPFLVAIHETEEQKESQMLMRTLKPRRLRKCLAIVKKDLIDLGLLTGAGADEVVRDGTNTESKGSPRKGGRKKADYETVQREAKVAADWEQARDDGTRKADFAKDYGIPLDELDRLLDRVAKRKKPSD
jgi:hypothetical protein